MFTLIRLWILSNRLTLLVFRLNGNTNRLNAVVNRLPTIYNPFIFTRLTQTVSVCFCFPGHLSSSISQKKRVKITLGIKWNIHLRYKVYVISMGRFIDVNINLCGGTHDAKVFANSRISKAMQEGKIPRMFRVLFPGRDEVHPAFKSLHERIFCMLQ